MDLTFDNTELERELAFRSGDGVEVRLLWHQSDGSLRVAVVDFRSGESFDIAAQPQRALDVFYHPYAYVSSQALHTSRRAATARR